MRNIILSIALMAPITVGLTTPSTAQAASNIETWAAFEAAVGAQTAANILHAFEAAWKQNNIRNMWKVAEAGAHGTTISMESLHSALYLRLLMQQAGALLGLIDLTSGYDARREAEREEALGGGFYDGSAWDDGFPVPGDGHGGDEDDWEVESECVPTEEEGEVPCDDSGIGVVIEWHDAAGVPNCSIVGDDEAMTWYGYRCAEAYGLPDFYVSWDM